MLLPKQWRSYIYKNRHCMMEGKGVALSSRPNGEKSKGNIKVVDGGCLHMKTYTDIDRN